MTTKPIETGGPAFPTNTENTPNAGACYASPGMDLRDYFAARALAQMVLAMSTTPKFNDVCITEARDCELTIEDYVSARAYDWADAMLKARST